MKVNTPVKGYTGIVAGVTFVDGAGETDEPNALAYFRRHGYVVGGKQKGDTPPAETPADDSEDTTEGVISDESESEETEDSDDDSEGQTDETDEDTVDQRPSGRASLETWTAYALAHGYDEEDLEGMGRNAVRDLFEEE